MPIHLDKAIPCRRHHRRNPSDPSETSLIPSTATPVSEVQSDTSVEVPPTLVAGQAGTETQSQTDAQSETEVQSDTDLQDHGEVEKESAASGSSTAPQWTIAESKKRSGLTKSRKKASKQAKADSLKKIAKLGGCTGNHPLDGIGDQLVP
jgi:hypothetical protein